MLLDYTRKFKDECSRIKIKNQTQKKSKTGRDKQVIIKIVHAFHLVNSFNEGMTSLVCWFECNYVSLVCNSIPTNTCMMRFLS